MSDVCELFSGAWDAVVTCFFLDTAHNIVEYIEIISRILKEGGVSSSKKVNIHILSHLLLAHV